MSKEYSEEELKKFRLMELIMWSRDIKIGEPLTEKQFKSVRHFMGDVIDAANAVEMKKISIHFDKVGQPHSIDNDGFIESVNGKKL